MKCALSLLLILTACCGAPGDPSTAEKHLTPAQQTRVDKMKSEATFVRHLSNQILTTGPLYKHLIEHPGIVSRAVRAYDLNQTAITRRGSLWFVDDGRGATGTLELLAVEKDSHLFVADFSTHTSSGKVIGTSVLFEVNVSKKGGEITQNVTAHVTINGLPRFVMQILLPFIGNYFDKRLDENFAGGREILRCLIEEQDTTLVRLRQAKALNSDEETRLKILIGKTVKLNP